MHNTPEQNQTFKCAWEATNALWLAQQKAFEADPKAYVAQHKEQKAKEQPK